MPRGSSFVLMSHNGLYPEVPSGMTATLTIKWTRWSPLHWICVMQAVRSSIHPASPPSWFLLSRLASARTRPFFCGQWRVAQPTSLYTLRAACSHLWKDAWIGRRSDRIFKFPRLAARCSDIFIHGGVSQPELQRDRDAGSGTAKRLYDFGGFLFHARRRAPARPHVPPR